MKQTTAKARLIFWSAIAALVILAMILCGVYTGTRVVTRGMPLNRPSVEQPQFVLLKEVTLEDAFSDITLEWMSGEVTVRKSSTGKTKLIQKGAADFPEEQRMELTKTDAGLKITDKNEGSRYFKTSRYSKTTEWTDIEVYLPEREYNSLTFLGTAPDIKAPGLWSKTLRLDITAGDFEFIGGRFSAIEVKTTSGDFICDTSVPASVSADTTVGSCEISGALTSILGKTTSGTLEFTTTRTATLDLDSTMGEAEAEGNFSSIRARTTNGTIQVESGILPTSIDGSTTSGKLAISLPESNAGFRAEVNKNSAGSFDTDFPVTLEAGVYRSGQGSGSYRFRLGSGQVRLVKANEKS